MQGLLVIQKLVTPVSEQHKKSAAALQKNVVFQNAFEKLMEIIGLGLLCLR